MPEPRLPSVAMAAVHVPSAVPFDVEPMVFLATHVSSTVPVTSTAGGFDDADGSRVDATHADEYHVHADGYRVDAGQQAGTETDAQARWASASS